MNIILQTAMNYIFSVYNWKFQQSFSYVILSPKWKMTLFAHGSPDWTRPFLVCPELQLCVRFSGWVCDVKIHLNGFRCCRKLLTPDDWQDSVGEFLWKLMEVLRKNRINIEYTRLKPEGTSCSMQVDENKTKQRTPLHKSMIFLSFNKF